MKAVILAGGKGTRLGEHTIKIPKPMVRIGKFPILKHIIDIFVKQGVREFYIAAGYKKKVIDQYFKKNKNNKINIKIVNTGLHSLTAKRIMLLKKFFFKGENFFMTYGDGLSNVNLKKLLKLHYKYNKVATLTAVRPPARFGEISIKKFFFEDSIKILGLTISTPCILNLFLNFLFNNTFRICAPINPEHPVIKIFLILVFLISTWLKIELIVD